MDVQLGRALLADVPQVGAVQLYGCVDGLGSLQLQLLAGMHRTLKRKGSMVGPLERETN